MFFVPKASKNWLNTAKLTITAIINNGNDSKHLSLDPLVSCCLRFYCGDAFCTDPFLQTDDVMHRSLCTEQFLCADTLTLLHTNAFTHRGLKKFLHRSFYTPMLCTKMLLHVWRHTGAFTHRTFYTGKPFHRTAFTQRSFYKEKLWHRETCTHRLHKEAFTHQSFYTETFPHRSLYAQKFLHIAVFTHRRFCTQMLLHWFF